MSATFSKVYHTVLSSAPTSPQTGEVVIYAKSTGLFIKDHAGVETKLSNVTAPSKTYRAFLTQSGTAAPTVTVFENGLSDVIAWTHTGTGVLLGTLTAAFTVNKTFLATSLAAGSVGVNLARTSADTITLTLLDDAGAGANTADIFVEVTVYP